MTVRLIGDRLYLPSANDKQRIERELVGYLNHGLTAANTYIAGSGNGQNNADNVAYFVCECSGLNPP